MPAILSLVQPPERYSFFQTFYEIDFTKRERERRSTIRADEFLKSSCPSFSPSRDGEEGQLISSKKTETTKAPTTEKHLIFSRVPLDDEIYLDKGRVVPVDERIRFTVHKLFQEKRLRFERNLLPSSKKKPFILFHPKI